MLVGASTHLSMIGGLPNLSRAKPRNAPKRPGKITVRRLVLNVIQELLQHLKPQLQQADLQRESLLHICAEPTLHLLYSFQILQGFTG
jgi:hypothetical protein